MEGWKIGRGKGGRGKGGRLEGWVRDFHPFFPFFHPSLSSILPFLPSFPSLLRHIYLCGVDCAVLAFVGGNLKGFWHGLNAR